MPQNNLEWRMLISRKCPQSSLSRPFTCPPGWFSSSGPCTRTSMMGDISLACRERVHAAVKRAVRTAAIWTCKSGVHLCRAVGAPCNAKVFGRRWHDACHCFPLPRGCGNTLPLFHRTQIVREKACNHFSPCIVLPAGCIQGSAEG